MREYRPYLVDHYALSQEGDPGANRLFPPSPPPRKLFCSSLKLQSLRGRGQLVEHSEHQDTAGQGASVSQTRVS